MWIQKTLTTDVCRTSWSCYKKLGLFCHNWKSFTVCVCSQEDPKKLCCCNVYTENPNHRCMQLHFMKLLQQTLTVLSQLEKLHNVSAVRRTRNTSKETMLLQCVIQKTLAYRYAASLHEGVATSSRCSLKKSCLSNTIHLMTCLLQSLSLSREVWEIPEEEKMNSGNLPAS